MGHTGLIPLDKNYFREHAYELIEEYLKAVPALTISDEERIKIQAQDLIIQNKDQNTKFVQLEARISELEGEKFETKSKIEELSDVNSEIDQLEHRISQLKQSRR